MLDCKTLWGEGYRSGPADSILSYMAVLSVRVNTNSYAVCSVQSYYSKAFSAIYVMGSDRPCRVCAAPCSDNQKSSLHSKFRTPAQMNGGVYQIQHYFRFHWVRLFTVNAWCHTVLFLGPWRGLDWSLEPLISGKEIETVNDGTETSSTFVDQVG